MALGLSDLVVPRGGHQLRGQSRGFGLGGVRILLRARRGNDSRSQGVGSVGESRLRGGGGLGPR